MDREIIVPEEMQETVSRAGYVPAVKSEALFTPLAK